MNTLNNSTKVNIIFIIQAIKDAIGSAVDAAVEYAARAEVGNFIYGSSRHTTLHSLAGYVYACAFKRICNL